MTPQNIGIVITTYNSPLWLRNVLLGYEAQSHTDFTTIIADDGSGKPTRAVVEEFKARGRLKLVHVWQEDDGFQKCRILNKAIAQTDCDYLIFTDGDCIPEPEFIAKHRALAAPGYFLSGGYVKLTTPVSQAITEADIQSGVIFDIDWLKANGQPSSHKLWKLSKSQTLKSLLNAVTPAKASWNGMNSSTWTADIKACNGFNEEMQYGGEDRELGERLMHKGLKSMQVRFTIRCLHLDHARSYNTPESWRKNDAIRAEVKRTRTYWTTEGIIKGPRPN